MSAILTVDASIRDRIWNDLQADSVLLTGGTAGAPLLAIDPTGAEFESNPALAIYPARLSDIDKPVYPCVTYRVAMLTPVRAFDNAAPGIPSAPIDDCRIDFEVWAGVGSDTLLVATVLGVIEQHYRNQALQLTGGSITGSNAYCFRCQQLASQPDLFDTTLRAYYGLASYLFRVQR